jgi:hypothetical protein
MYAQREQPKGINSSSASDLVRQHKRDNKQRLSFVDQRPRALFQLQLQTEACAENPAFSPFESAQLRRIDMPDLSTVITEDHTSDELHNMIASRFMVPGTYAQLTDLNAAIEAREYRHQQETLGGHGDFATIDRGSLNAVGPSKHSANLSNQSSKPTKSEVETQDSESAINVNKQPEPKRSQSQSETVSPPIQPSSLVTQVTGAGLVLAGAGGLTWMAHWHLLKTPIRSLVLGRLSLLRLLGAYGLGYVSMAAGGTLLNAPTSFAALTRGGSMEGGSESGMSLSTWLLGLGLSSGSLAQIASMAIRRQTLNGAGIGIISRSPHLLSSLIILGAGQRLMGVESSLSESYRAFLRDSSQTTEPQEHDNQDFFNFILGGGLIGAGTMIASRGLRSNTGFIGENLSPMRGAGLLPRTRYVGLASLALSLGIGLTGAESLLPHLAPGMTPEHPGFLWQDPFAMTRLFMAMGLGVHGYGNIQQAVQGGAGILPRLRTGGYGAMVVGGAVLLSGALPALGDDWQLRAATGTGLCLLSVAELRRIRTQRQLWRPLPTFARYVTGMRQVPRLPAVPAIALASVAFAGGISLLASSLTGNNINTPPKKTFKKDPTE